MPFCLAIIALIWLALSLPAEDGITVRGGADGGRSPADTGTAGDVSQNVTNQAGQSASGFFAELCTEVVFRPADDFAAAVEPCGVETILKDRIAGENLGVFTGGRIDRRPGRTLKTSAFVRFNESEDKDRTGGRWPVHTDAIENTIIFCQVVGTRIGARRLVAPLAGFAPAMVPAEGVPTGV